MSYMDRKNILDEGFFGKLLQTLKKAKSSSKVKKNKEVKKAYDDALEAVNDANESLKKRLKELGLEDPVAGL